MTLPCLCVEYFQGVVQKQFKQNLIMEEPEDSLWEVGAWLLVTICVGVFLYLFSFAVMYLGYFIVPIIQNIIEGFN